MDPARALPNARLRNPPRAREGGDDGRRVAPDAFPTALGRGGFHLGRDPGPNPGNRRLLAW
eukprot:10462259-Lingulodinium_polyedra.AAC.1